MNTIITANDSTTQQTSETLSSEHYAHQQEAFRAKCAELLDLEREALRFNERGQRTRMAAINLNMLTSYLEDHVFDDAALFFLESAVSSAREALEQHARTLAFQAIERYADGADITPALRAEALAVLLASEPEYSPARRVLVDMQSENMDVMREEQLWAS